MCVDVIFSTLGAMYMIKYKSNKRETGTVANDNCEIYVVTGLMFKNVFHCNVCFTCVGFGVHKEVCPCAYMVL
jgi:hypothetical protein